MTSKHKKRPRELGAPPRARRDMIVALTKKLLELHLEAVAQTLRAALNLDEAA